jgi:hypothetical protein
MGTFAARNLKESGLQQIADQISNLAWHGYNLNFSVWLMNATGFS